MKEDVKKFKTCFLLKSKVFGMAAPSCHPCQSFAICALSQSHLLKLLF